MAGFRLTTRRADRFTEAEERLLLFVAKHREVWFASERLERHDRDALNMLQRLGHVIYDPRGRPSRVTKAGGCGYLISNVGMEAIAELKRREQAGEATS